MSTCRWFFIGVVFLFSACGGKSQPVLHLDGHWVVDHGFDDTCRVTASFYRSQTMILSFYSVTEDACQTEFYGIAGDAVMFGISSKKDFFDDQGALSTEVKIYAGSLRLEGKIRMTETANGLRAVILSAEDDATKMLDPLINHNFTLKSVPVGWVRLLSGWWGAGCSPLSISGECQVLEFRSDGLGQHTQFEKCSDNFTCEISRWGDFVYSLRNFEKLADDRYKIDIVTFGPGSGDHPKGESFTLILSDESLELVGFEFFTRLEELPFVP